MIVGVADTHAVIWYLSADSRLSANAKQFMDNAANSGDQIAVSSITLIEIVYLIEKGRIPTTALTSLTTALRQTKPTFIEIPVSSTIAQSMAYVSSTQIPDMPDRIIAATALHLNVPLISRDRKIQASNVRTIW
jgi:PIN domain nuclease of toxin-antitoxin system